MWQLPRMGCRWTITVLYQPLTTRSDPGQDGTIRTHIANSATDSFENALSSMNNIANDEADNGGWENIQKDEHNTPRWETPREQSQQNSRDASPSQSRVLLRRETPSPTLVDSRQKPSLTWQDLRKRRLEVVRTRVKLKEERALLQIEKRKINDKEARLLPALKAASSDITITLLQDVLAQVELLAELREQLNPAKEAQERLEEQLIAQDAALTDLEANIYANATTADSPKFPAGGLDFTSDETGRPSSILGLPASASEYLPEQHEYDVRLREVNSIRERLLDLQAEHDQLLREQEKRHRVGRSLDAYSLGAIRNFEDDFPALTIQLDHAEDQLMLAEANLFTRKRTLERRDISQAEEENFYEQADTSVTSVDPESPSMSDFVAFLLGKGEEQTPIFRVPSASLNGQTVNMARFINQWLLQRLRQVPEEAVRFAHKLAASHIVFDSDCLPETILSRWTEDGSEEEFIVTVEAGEHSYTGSLEPLNGLAQIFHDRAQSQHLRPNTPDSQTLWRTNSG